VPETFLSAADVDVDPVRRRFSSSIDGVRLAGREPAPAELAGRPREMALRRDLRHGRQVKYLKNRAHKTRPGHQKISGGKRRLLGRKLRRDLIDGRKYQGHVTKVSKEQSWQDKAKAQEHPCGEHGLMDSVLRRDLRHGGWVKYLKNTADKKKPWFENIKVKNADRWIQC